MNRGKILPLVGLAGILGISGCSVQPLRDANSAAIVTGTVYNTADEMKVGETKLDNGNVLSYSPEKLIDMYDNKVFNLPSSAALQYRTCEETDNECKYGAITQGLEQITTLNDQTLRYRTLKNAEVSVGNYQNHYADGLQKREAGRTASATIAVGSFIGADKAAGGNGAGSSGTGSVNSGITDALSGGSNGGGSLIEGLYNP